MKIIRIQDVPTEERVSPKGRYHVRQKNISLSLGGIKDVGPAGGGHPFDICEVTIPPGKTNWPFHFHCAQWEFFLVKQGNGKVRTKDKEITIRAGDSFIQPPGKAHQIHNDGTEDLVLFIIADNPACDTIGYPDTGQWFIKPARKLLSGEENEFYSGEE